METFTWLQCMRTTSGVEMTIVRGIYLRGVVADVIQQDSQMQYTLETGRILIGRIEGERVIVTHGVGPGPNAIHQPAMFLRDGAYAQQQLDKYVALSDDIDDYIGEWHSHPIAVGPSLQDRESMRWISTQPAYNQKKSILILCQRMQHNQWLLRGYWWHRTVLRSLPIMEGG